MKHLLIFVSCLLAINSCELSSHSQGTEKIKCDVCIYGESASGCIAAICSAREGKTTVMIARNGHVGGLVTSGLTATDMNRHSMIGGVTMEFYGRIWDYYQNPAVWRNQTREEFMESTLKRTYTGKNDERKIQWVYESGVAEKIMRQMLSEAGVKIIPDAQIVSANKKGTKITSITLTNGETVESSMYIDCSYTGDLMAKVGVSYTYGREPISQYNESLAGIRVNRSLNLGSSNGYSPTTGKVLPYVDMGLWGKEGDGDKRIQSYCYRVTLTDDPSNMRQITKPEGYNPDLYEVTLSQILANPAWELNKVISFTPMPNRKTDTNHLDFFNAANDYPEADYEKRLEIEAAHKNYAQGMMWFLGHDPRVPEKMRTEMLRWGYAADEFTDTDNFPNHMYVRESRRMIGEYVMKQGNLEKNGRVVAPSSVGNGTYSMDCHYISTVCLDGKLYREGSMMVAPGTYPISYLSLTPKKNECTNLLVTVCLSASHVAYASIRMEPQYMVLGQSAASAACLCIDGRCAVQDLKYDTLKKKLLEGGQIL